MRDMSSNLMCYSELGLAFTKVTEREREGQGDGGSLMYSRARSGTGVLGRFAEVLSTS